jgi:hypothetical protein
MILSSADILRILGGSEIIRLSAKLKIVDGKPALSGAEGLFIYIDRFPKTDEFQATWSIYIESDGSEPDDLVLAEIKKLLPSVKVEPGLMTTVITTDFLSANTQRAPEAPKQVQVQADLTQYEERFQALVEDVQDQMLLVTSGRPGRDGKDGRDGADGRDGRDIQASETDLEDLANVEQGIVKENGQVLTWKDGKWQNLFVPQIVSSISGTSSGDVVAGSDAVSATIQWKYHAERPGVEPHAGDFHTDSQDGELVTKIHVSTTTNRGNDISVLIEDLLTQGYDRLYVAQSADLSQAHLYQITGYVPTVGGTELSVTHVQTAGTEPDFIPNATYEFYISKSADTLVPQHIDDLLDVDTTTTPPSVGDILKWDGSNWVPTADTGGGGGGGGGCSYTVSDGGDFDSGTAQETGCSVDAGIEEAPQDGNYYVRQNGAWVNLADALTALDNSTIDGGDFTTGSSAGDTEVVDGGSFS